MDNLTYNIKITSLEENMKKQKQKIEKLEYKVKKLQTKNKKNKNKKHKSECDFCKKIYYGYTSKDFPFIYYVSNENKFILSSEYHGHNGTRYLDDINFCPKCGRNLYKRRE